MRVEEHRCRAHRLQEAHDIKNAASRARIASATLDVQTPPVTPRTPPRTAAQFTSDGKISASRCWNPAGEATCPELPEKEARQSQRRQVVSLSSSGIHCAGDELLESFLARCAETFPFAAGVGQRCHPGRTRSFQNNQEPIRADWAARDSESAAANDGACGASAGPIDVDKWNLQKVLW